MILEVGHAHIAGLHAFVTLEGEWAGNHADCQCAFSLAIWATMVLRRCRFRARPAVTKTMSAPSVHCTGRRMILGRLAANFRVAAAPRPRASLLPMRTRW